jgi:hypothetical protein
MFVHKINALGTCEQKNSVLNENPQKPLSGQLNLNVPHCKLRLKKFPLFLPGRGSFRQENHQYMPSLLTPSIAVFLFPFTCIYSVYLSLYAYLFTLFTTLVWIGLELGRGKAEENAPLVEQEAD